MGGQNSRRGRRPGSGSPAPTLRPKQKSPTEWLYVARDAQDYSEYLLKMQATVSDEALASWARSVFPAMEAAIAGTRWTDLFDDPPPDDKQVYAATVLARALFVPAHSLTLRVAQTKTHV